MGKTKDSIIIGLGNIMSKSSDTGGITRVKINENGIPESSTSGFSTNAELQISSAYTVLALLKLLLLLLKSKSLSKHSPKIPFFLQKILKVSSKFFVPKNYVFVAEFNEKLRQILMIVGKQREKERVLEEILRKIEGVLGQFEGGNKGEHIVDETSDKNEGMKRIGEKNESDGSVESIDVEAMPK